MENTSSKVGCHGRLSQQRSVRQSKIPQAIVALYVEAKVQVGWCSGVTMWRAYLNLSHSYYDKVTANRNWQNI